MTPTADSTSIEETRLIHGNQVLPRRTPSFPHPLWAIQGLIVVSAATGMQGMYLVYQKNSNCCQQHSCSSSRTDGTGSSLHNLCPAYREGRGITFLCFLKSFLSNTYMYTYIYGNYTYFWKKYSICVCLLLATFSKHVRNLIYLGLQCCYFVFTNSSSNFLVMMWMFWSTKQKMTTVFEVGIFSLLP